MNRKGLRGPLPFYFSNRPIVLAEQDKAQVASSNSPTKVYAALKVATPQSRGLAAEVGTPSEPPLQIDEGITVETHTNPSALKITDPASDTVQGQTQDLSSETVVASTPDTTPVKSMDALAGNFTQSVYQDLIPQCSSQMESPRFDQFLPQTGNNDDVPQNPAVIGLDTELNPEDIRLQEDIVHAGEESTLRNTTLPSLSITRQEILVLSSVLDRIPPAFLTSEEIGIHHPMGLTIVDDLVPAVVPATSSQEELTMQTDSGTTHQGASQSVTLARGKRRRARYSLTGGMLKKHPVLKFSATGPLDKGKSPHKWWCRVCKVELSLMSRGSLELISHYRSEAHLIKEHRIRMEVPGMPLFDKDQTELLGVALQEAKRKAKDTYPIAPQLDSCRPLVGQESIPDFTATSSPTDKVLSQISILEFGLKHGGHISSLTGMYDELVRLTSSDRLSMQNWGPERLFVSLFFPSL